ncbi:MAG: PEP-CTERM sorting domain-containing protein [Opitutaceae bacterium]|jgi:hypothetical protein|nr:PEP-CTERM sorting domain-containing protein [Opitutaceae bacterium]
MKKHVSRLLFGALFAALPGLCHVSLAETKTTMIDFGTSDSAVAVAANISATGGMTIDHVVQNLGADITALTVGPETLALSFNAVTGVRKRETTGFTDSTANRSLAPYIFDLVFNTNPTDGLQVTISGLTIGNQYQMFFHTVDAQYTRDITVTNITNPDSPVSLGTVSFTQGSAVVSSFTDYQVNTGIFTATSESVTFKILAFGDTVNALAALTISAMGTSQVPEPGVIGLLMGGSVLGLVLFIQRRRRRTRLV